MALFTAILTALGTGVTGVFTLFTNVFDGGISMIYDGTAITGLGGVIILGGLVGLAKFGMAYVIQLIPFARKG